MTEGYPTRYFISTMKYTIGYIELRIPSTHYPIHHQTVTKNYGCLLVEPPLQVHWGRCSLLCGPAFSWGTDLKGLLWGYPNSWMVYFVENPKIKWMIWGYRVTPSLGHPHLIIILLLFCLIKAQDACIIIIRFRFDFCLLIGVIEINAINIYIYIFIYLYICKYINK